MITFQKYVKAADLEEAYSLNQSRKNRIVGGMLWLRLGNSSYNTVIDISDLGLDRIEEDEEQFRIGAMVTLRELETHKGLNDYTGSAICHAVKDIIGGHFMNMATLGGSIWGRFGYSDVLTVFMSLDTYVELYKGGIVSLAEFVKMKRDNDILTHIIVKKKPLKCVYDAVRIQRTDFPVLTCAVSEVDGEVRTVIGARPGVASLVLDAEGILASGINNESAVKFAEYVAASVETKSNSRGSAEYRKHLAKVLCERAINEVGGML